MTNDDGRVLAAMPLPIAVLIATEPAEAAARAYAACDGLAKTLGFTLTAPFMILSFMALPVIPSLKLTAGGLFNGIAFRHVPLFVD